MFAPTYTLDLEIDRNGFAVCRECGEDNGGTGDVAHLFSCAAYGIGNDGEEIDPTPCCPAPGEHGTRDGSCDYRIDLMN